jgi:hypothetical protein
MEELRRAHERHVEEERAAEKKKEELRKARAKAERKRRDRAAAERAQAGSQSTPSRTPAPWPQEMNLTCEPDTAADARRVATKSASLEQAAEHSARLCQQEEDRIQETQRKMEALRLAKLIQRGD